MTIASIISDVHNGLVVSRIRRAQHVQAVTEARQRQRDLAAVKRLADALAYERRRSADLERQLDEACLLLGQARAGR